MSCDDKDGKPDLTAARARKPAPASGTRSVQGSSARQAVPAYSSPYLSAEEMAAFRAEYQPTVSAQQLIAQKRDGSQSGGFSRWGDKPKYSASPLEHTAGTDAKPAAGDSCLCPRCREGQLRRINGKNGAFWGCTNYPHCTATFDDDKGKPVLS